MELRDILPMAEVWSGTQLVMAVCIVPVRFWVTRPMGGLRCRVGMMWTYTVYKYELAPAIDIPDILPKL